MQDHKVGNFMVKDVIWGLDLTFEVRNSCIKLLMRRKVDQVGTLGVPSDTLQVRDQGPDVGHLSHEGEAPP